MDVIVLALEFRREPYSLLGFWAELSCGNRCCPVDELARGDLACSRDSLGLEKDILQDMLEAWVGNC